MTIRSQRLPIALGAAAALVFAGLPAPAAAQSTGLVALHGTEELRAGFTPDPHVVSVRAGGRIAVNDTGLPEDCAGSITDAPTYELKFVGGSSALTFRTVSDADTTLIINGPDSRWHCDDDSGEGLNAELRFDPPQSGTYDVWVGGLGDPGASARLEITELASRSEDSDEEGTIWGDPISSQPTQLDIKVCNQSGRHADVALGYHPIGEDRYVTQGWYALTSGECRVIASTQNLTYYVFAQTVDGSGLEWGGDFGLCVQFPGPFRETNYGGGDCASYESWRGFKPVTASGYGEQTFNLW